MIGFNFLWIVFFISYILSFVGLIFFRFMFENEKISYSFKRNFPYEILTLDSKISTIYKVFLFIFGGLFFSPLFCVVPLIGEFGSIAWLAIVLSILFGFCGVFVVALHLFEAKFIKVHSIIASVSIALSFLCSGMSALYSFLTFNVNNRFGEGRPIQIVTMAFLIALALFDVIVAVNPKLKEWTKLEQMKLPDGTIGYDRPKIFPLAFSEWLIIFSIFFSEILFFVSLLKI